MSYFVICLVEHWLKAENKAFYNLNGFKLTAVYCRNTRMHGGAAIYVLNDMDFTVIDVSSFCVEMFLEICAIRLPALKTIILSLYKPSGCSDTIFFEHLELLLDFLATFNCNIAICGDFNIEARRNGPATIKLHNLLRSTGLYCTNFIPV